jgi:hypothetical protein
MNSVVRIAALAGASFLLSFAGGAYAQDTSRVTMDDQRTEEGRKHFRASTFSAIAFIGDKGLKAPPVEKLRTALSKRTTQPLAVVVTELRVADFFPVRLKAGLPGGLVGNAISEGLVNSKTDWSFVNDIGLTDKTDAILCLFAGTVNGKDIKVATFAPYKISLFAVRVNTQKEYVAAIESVYEQAAQKIVDQVGGGAPTPVAPPLSQGSVTQ